MKKNIWDWKGRWSGGGAEGDNVSDAATWRHDVANDWGGEKNSPGGGNVMKDFPGL